MLQYCYIFFRLIPINGGYNNSLKSTSYSTKVFAPPATPMLVKLPKRMKFIYFWARTRMVQRGLMVRIFLNETLNSLNSYTRFLLVAPVV